MSTNKNETRLPKASCVAWLNFQAAAETKGHVLSPTNFVVSVRMNPYKVNEVATFLLCYLHQVDSGSVP
jgi:hypothetical protein